MFFLLFNEMEMVLKIIQSHLIKKYTKYMIFAFLSKKIKVEDQSPISFIHVQNVIETFDENLGNFIVKNEKM